MSRARIDLAIGRFAGSGGAMLPYYGWAGRDFVFASELKAIRCHPRFDGEISRQALRLFAARNYIPAPLSIYRRIFKLEPGCILELGTAAATRPLGAPPAVGSRSNGLSLSRYWSYRDVLREGLGNPLSSEGEAVDALEAVLGEAVRGQSIADVPVGAFLSGGVDSSSVVALYQKHSSQPVRTFTIGFEEAAFNEAAYARAVAEHFGTRHHERIVTPREAQAVIPELPQIYDEPFADSSQIPTFLVSRFAREQVTVSLSGDGGDELFGGYNRYLAGALLWSRLKHLPRPVRAAAGTLLGRVPPAAWSGLGRAIYRKRPPRYFGEKVRTWLQVASAAGSFADVAGPLFDEWRNEAPVIDAPDMPTDFALDFDLAETAPDQLRMMYCDALSYLPDDILCKVDRASMAVSLESRVPFLDHRVAALAARIPLDMKIRGGTGKHVLRKLLYREAPATLFERPKSGFAIPVGDWIKGPLRDWAESLLDARKMRGEGWFVAELVEERWRDHLSGRRDSASALWAVLMFQAWLADSREISLAA